MIYIYNAGPLFNEAAVKQRLLEGKMLEEALKEAGKEYFVANPISLPFDYSKPVNSKDIFIGDYEHINKSNVFFFELATGDPGTYVELGAAIEKLMNGKDLKIYPIFSDIRLSRNNIDGVECPIGFNSYLVGSLTANDIKIHYSFEEAFEAFKKDFNI